MLSNYPTIKTVVLILLSTCTIIFFNNYGRYQVVGPELLENADLRNELEHWEHTGTGITVYSKNEVPAKLDATTSIQSPSLSQAIRPFHGFQLLRLSCDIKTQNIIGGDKDWETARVVLISHNKEGEEMYYLPHVLANQRGNSDWRRYEKVFTIAPDASEITVAAQIVESTGSLWVKSFSLRPVALKIAFKQYRQALLLVWLATTLWVAAPFVKSGLRSLKHGVVLMLAIGIILGVIMPENLKESLGATFLPSTATAVASFIPNRFNDTQSFNLSPNLPVLDIYKAGHFIMFTLLAVTLFGNRLHSISTARLLTYLVLFALVTEVLQLFMAGRTAQFGDIFIDSCGIATGFAVAWLWRRYHEYGPNV
jgi:VanZ family protein